MPEVIDFMLKPNVDSTVLHMCAFGMTAKDEQGEGLVQKATSDELLRRDHQAGDTAMFQQRRWPNPPTRPPYPNEGEIRTGISTTLRRKIVQGHRYSEEVGQSWSSVATLDEC